MADEAMVAVGLPHLALAAAVGVCPCWASAAGVVVACQVAGEAAPLRRVVVAAVGEAVRWHRVSAVAAVVLR